MVNLFAIHGILQLITFAVLFPLGILIAIFRERVGPNWFKLHVGIQITGSLTLLSALIIVSIAKKQKQKEDNDSITHLPAHVIVGRIVVILVILQLIWAIAFRHIIPRPIWFAIHMVLATGIITVGWTNLYLGYRHYKNLD